MRLENLTRKKAEEYFKNNDTVILAVGSIENHGYHNALGTDTLIPNKILSMIEDKTNILICPTIPYGATDSLSSFVGTINLGYDVLYGVLKKVTESLYNAGIRKFIFLNGHGGNNSALNQVSLDLDKINAVAAIFNWWQIAPQLNKEWLGGHGGFEETSALLTIDESLVDFNEIKEMDLQDLTQNIKTTSYAGVTYKGIDVIVSRNIKNVTDNGWIGNDHPKLSSNKMGMEMLEATSSYFLDFITEFSKIDTNKLYSK